VSEVSIRRVLAVAVVGGALAGCATPALAQARSFPTEVTVNIAAFGRGVFAEGQLLSPKRACLAGRKVLIVAITPSGNEVVETDRSSDNGFYGGRGRARGGRRPTGLKVKVPRAVLGRPGDRTVCRRGVYAIHIPPG
jgi:hypothetical protein